MESKKKQLSGVQTSAKRTIKVTCKGAGLAQLEDLHPLQGDLKTLSEENFQKCKNALTGKHGFSFPFFVWRDKGKLWVLDGHQRDKTLKRLEQDGWKVPLLPVDYIEAGNQKEAKEKILLLSSQYGEMTDESLSQFIKEAELDIAGLSDSLALRDLDRALNDLLTEVKPITVPDPPPKLAWVLIGIPLVRFDEISSDIERLAKVQGIIMEMTQNDGPRRKDG